MAFTPPLYVGVITDSAKLQLLNAMRVSWRSWMVCLLEACPTPTQSQTIFTVTESTFAGYSRQPIANPSAAIMQPDGHAYSTANSVLFTNAGLTPAFVVGWGYVQGIFVGSLKASGLFPAPITLLPGHTLAFTPVLDDTAWTPCICPESAVMPLGIGVDFGNFPAILSPYRLPLGIGVDFGNFPVILSPFVMPLGIGLSFALNPPRPSPYKVPLGIGLNFALNPPRPSPYKVPLGIGLDVGYGPPTMPIGLGVDFGYEPPTMPIGLGVDFGYEPPTMPIGLGVDFGYEPPTMPIGLGVDFGYEPPTMPIGLGVDFSTNPNPPGSGPTNTACGYCSLTWTTWTTTISGMTGPEAIFNGTWQFAWTHEFDGQCVFTIANPGTILDPVQTTLEFNGTDWGLEMQSLGGSLGVLWLGPGSCTGPLSLPKYGMDPNQSTPVIVTGLN